MIFRILTKNDKQHNPKTIAIFLSNTIILYVLYNVYFIVSKNRFEKMDIRMYD